MQHNLLQLFNSITKYVIILNVLVFFFHGCVLVAKSIIKHWNTWNYWSANTKCGRNKITNKLDIVVIIEFE